MTSSSVVVESFAPSGRMRVGINLGNPVIAQRGTDAELRGIGPALARELARRLGVAVDFVTFDTAGKLAEAVGHAAWDVAFLAVDPERAVDIAFSPPYLLIEGTYMVRSHSPLASSADVDRPGVRVAVGNKTAYDLYLTRNVKAAELVRAPSSQAAVDLFLAGQVDAVAGVRQILDAAAARAGGLRVFAEPFMVIRQAAGVPRQRSAAHAYLAAFIEEAKASGFAAQALRDSGVEGASIAPAGA